MLENIKRLICKIKGHDFTAYTFYDGIGDLHGENKCDRCGHDTYEL